MDKSGEVAAKRTLVSPYGHTQFEQRLTIKNQSVLKAVKGINKLRVRVRCEHVFGRMSQMAMDRLRTIGLLQAKQHNGLCNLVYNMGRYAFLCR